MQYHLLINAIALPLQHQSIIIVQSKLKELV